MRKKTLKKKKKKRSKRKAEQAGTRGRGVTPKVRRAVFLFRFLVFRYMRCNSVLKSVIIKWKTWNLRLPRGRMSRKPPEAGGGPPLAASGASARAVASCGRRRLQPALLAPVCRGSWEARDREARKLPAERAAPLVYGAQAAVPEWAIS